MNSGYKSFVKDNAIVLAGHVLIYLKSLVFLPLVIKLAGTATYGAFTLLISFLGIFSGIASLGVGFKYRRYMPSSTDRDEKRALFFPQFFFQVCSTALFSCIFLLFQEQFNLYFFKEEIEYSPFLIPLFLLSYLIFAQGSDYFRYTCRAKYLTTATLVFPYFQVVLVFAFSFSAVLGVDSLLWSQIISAVVVSVPCIWVIIRELGMCWSFPSKNEIWSDILLGFPVILVFLVDFVLAGVDRYFIAFYMSITDVGYYNPGYVLGSLIVFFPKAICTVLPQILAKEVDTGGDSRAVTMVDYTVKFFLILAIPFVFGSFFLGESILFVLTNSEVAENGWLIVPTVAAGTLLYGLNLILGNILYIKKQTYVYFKINAYSAIFNFFANAIFIGLVKNIVVAAFTTFLSYLLSFVLTQKVVRKGNWLVSFYWSTIGKSILASIIMSFFLFYGGKFFPGTSIFLICIQVIAGSLVYFSTLLLLGVLQQKEIQFVKSLLQC